MKKYTLSISSSKKNIILVEDMLIEVNKAFHLDEDKFQRFQIAVSEMIINAIVHGNKEQADKKVLISIEFDERKITVFVTDEGNGFDIDTVPDPTIEENISKISGRGLFIIRSLVDEFSYKHTDKGSTFTLSMFK
ncbi:MAG: ATP-binding protein [Ignavibacteria bacterium]|jgi:serine/threonine-protein kinase RsbW